MAAEIENEGSRIPSSESNATSTEDEADSYHCSICFSITHVLQCVLNVKEFQGILGYIESRAPHVEKIVNACATCVYKLYLASETFNSKSKDGRHQGILDSFTNLTQSPEAGGASTSSPLFPPATMAKNKSRVDLDQSSSSSSSSSHFQHAANGLCDQDQENGNVNEEEQNVTQAFENANHDRQSNPNRSSDVASNSSSSPSHLDIMYECTESALITESGGTLDQYKNPPLQCRYCPKIFVLRKPYIKHMRSHASKLSSVRSGSTSRGRSTPNHIVYACTDCSATFDSSAKLKVHCRIHLKRYYCTYCHKENFNLFAHDFHEAECKGKELAKDVETRRITRSIARSTRSVQSEKVQKNSNKTAKVDKKSKSLRSRKTSTGKKRSNVDDNEDEDDDEDAATSMACTDNTGFTSFIENWVAGTCRSEYETKSLSILKKTSQFDDAEPVIVSQKEYDIIMLERLILQSHRNVYSCSTLNCDHFTNNLREMCLHEMRAHNARPYYYCRKCGGLFTSKLFLDYHMYLQNYGEYHCNKCTMRYNYEYQLQYHLLQHQKNDAFPCLYCANSFMSNQELRIHCLETGHDPKKRKKTISIDHTMTIVNETDPEPPPPKRSYKCTINIMNLSKNKTKHQLHHLWASRTRIFIGDLDFEYEPGRNCVQTK